MAYINSNKKDAFIQFTSILEKYLNDICISSYDNIVIICIGTDRSTGDSLGPLIGYKLSNLNYRNVFIHGTLDNPVHAKNLEQTLLYIENSYKNPLIIAIDACLGTIEHIGYITVCKGPIKPGIAVKKHLSEVGDISITGIVNMSGFMEIMVLQNTRLNLVMKMADLITIGLKYILWKVHRHSYVPPKQEIKYL